MLAKFKYCKQLDLEHDGWKITKDSREKFIVISNQEGEYKIPIYNSFFFTTDVICNIFHIIGDDGSFVYYINNKFIYKKIPNVQYLYHDSNGIYMGEYYDYPVSAIRRILKTFADTVLQTPLFENDTDVWTLENSAVYRKNKTSLKKVQIVDTCHFTVSRYKDQLILNPERLCEYFSPIDLYGRQTKLIAGCVWDRDVYYQILDTNFILSKKVNICRLTRSYFDDQYLYIKRWDSMDIYGPLLPKNYCYLEDKDLRLVSYCLWIRKVHPTLKLYIPKRLMVEKIVPLFLI